MARIVASGMQLAAISATSATVEALQQVFYVLQAAVATTVEAAGAQQVAARLAALEAALPLAALRTGEWAPWAAWRRTLAHAESATVLAALVRNGAWRRRLAARPEVLPGSGAVWACGTRPDPRAACLRSHALMIIPSCAPSPATRSL